MGNCDKFRQALVFDDVCTKYNNAVTLKVVITTLIVDQNVKCP